MSLAYVAFRAAWWCWWRDSLWWSVVYHYAVPVSVFITVGGGIYFLYLLLVNRRV